MIDFYSRQPVLTNPWAKYSQITGQDYVSGAMEKYNSHLTFRCITTGCKRAD